VTDHSSAAASLNSADFKLRDTLKLPHVVREDSVAVGQGGSGNDKVVDADEAALRRIIGSPAIMAAQLHYVLHMAQLPNIDVQVLPFSAGAHAALAAPFTILEFAEPLDTPIVYVETITDALFLEEGKDVEQYNATFGDVQGSALSTAQSAAFIKDVAASLESP
jgi:hypothetical protein